MKPTLLRMREGKPGGGKGPLLSEDLSLTLTGVQDVLFQPVYESDIAPTLLAPNTTAQPVDGKRQDGSRTDRIPITAYRTPASSAASAASTSASNEQAGVPSASARSTPTPAPSSPSDGPECPTSVMSFYSTAGTRDLGYGPVAPSLKLGSGTGAPGVTAVLIGIAQPSGRAASPARTSVSQASAEGSQESAADSPSPSSTLWSDTDLPSSSSKTYRDSSPRMGAATLGRSSVAWQTSGTWGLTEFSTLSGSECPSDAAACSCSPSTLSDILMKTAPARFSLSARAAQGIIRRSERRGRSLPAELAMALASLARQAKDGGPKEMSPAPSGHREAEAPTTPSTTLPPASGNGSDQTTRQATSQPGTTSQPTTSSWTVRRLTPTECERLMGWPDGWTVVDGWQPRSTQAATAEASALSRGSISSSEPSASTFDPAATPTTRSSSGLRPLTDEAAEAIATWMLEMLGGKDEEW